MTNFIINDAGVEREATDAEVLALEAIQAAAAIEAAAAQAAEMVSYMDTVRALREQILNRLAGIGTFAIDDETKEVCGAARLRLLAITTIPAAMAATDLASLQVAIKTEYASIVASVPDSLKNAFNEISQ